MGKLHTKDTPSGTTMWVDMDEDEQNALIHRQPATFDQAEAEDGSTHNIVREPPRFLGDLPGPAYHCEDCGGDDVLDLMFTHHGEESSPRYCFNCVEALVRKHLTPVKEMNDACRLQHAGRHGGRAGRDQDS